MKYLKVIITFLLVFSMAFCIIVPVGASDYTSQISTYWEQFCHNLNSMVPYLGDLPGLLCSEVCTKSTDGLHHCTSLDNATLANTGHDDKGWYCNCTCAYCGKTFRAYSSDFEHAYNTYVTALPAAGFGRNGASDTSGYVVWYPHYAYHLDYNKSYYVINDYQNYSLASHMNDGAYVGAKIGIWLGAGSASSQLVGVVPITGHYTGFVDLVGGSFSPSVYDNNEYRTQGSTLYNASPCIFYISQPVGSSIVSSWKFGYKIVPDVVMNDVYPTSSRVNTVINNYAIKNEDNTYNYITNKPIFDENTLVFYDPLTGVSFNVTGWYYDYSNRRYVLTYKDDSNTVKTTSVEYGDENIKVSTGTTTNNYYYTVPDTSYKHTYVVSNTLSPTCTAPGSKTYTCTKCNDTYTETVPALGHNWVKGETVPTTYEADGTTVKTKGYTLYTCSRCGEKYYDYDGSGPPGTTESTPTLNWLQRIYYKLVDILNAVLGIDTSVTVDTASNTDIKVTVPAEDGSKDQQFSLKDMKAKFGWLHEIHTIMSTFVSDVTSDSNNAYAMAATSSAVSTNGSQSVAAVTPSSSGSAAPSIVIDFSKAQSVYGYNYGGQSQVIDLSWYAQYKPTVDAIVSGFLWLLFLWGIFKHAPGIISGSDVNENELNYVSRRLKF